MLFSVEQDKGPRIVAYVVPDTVGTTPVLKVSGGGKELLTIEANQVRQNLVAAGRHETGKCGFIIDNTLIPGLAKISDLEIVETTTNLLIYRRRPKTAQTLRAFRLENHLLPLWRLDMAVKDSFQYWYKGIERFGLETSSQVFCMKDADSVYVSGRLYLRRFEHHIRRGMKAVALIRDPFHEMAERLIVLKNIGNRAEEVLGARDALTFQALMHALEDLQNFDESSCRKFFRRQSEEVLFLLSNPLVRQLAGATAEEKPTQTSVSVALESLAAFDVLGVRSDAETFTRALSEFIGVDASTLPSVEEYPRIVELGERLRNVSGAEALIEKDLEVFHFVKQAFLALKP